MRQIASSELLFPPRPDSRHHRSVRRILTLWYLPAALLVAAVTALQWDSPETLRLLVIEPVPNDYSLQYALLTNLGFVLWCVGAAVCLFSGALIRALEPWSDAPRFFLGIGGLTLLLAIDDLFRLHESFFPFYLGIYEHYLFVAYGAAMAVILWISLPFILTTAIPILLLSMGFFALSIGLDVLVYRLYDFPTREWLEDAFKFLGILGLTLYFLTSCFGEVRRAAARAGRRNGAKAESLDGGA